MATQKQLRHLDDMRPAPYNPRSISKEALVGLRDSVGKFGDISGIVWNKRTGHLVAGHQRVEVLRELGAKLVEGQLVAGRKRFPVRVVDWDAATEKAANIAANNPHIAGEFTADLAPLLTGIETGLGDAFGELRLDALFKDHAPPAKVDEDEAPDPPKKAITKPGDVWTLGRHRVVCGDAIDHRYPIADVVWTDPPYGMNLDPDYNAMFDGIDGYHPSGKFDRVVGDEVGIEIGSMFAKLAAVKEQFWFGADYYRATLPAGGSWVVWDKRTASLDVLPGSSFELCWSRRKHKRLVARILWSGHHGMQKDDTKKRVHPTQKPVALVSWFADKWFKPGCRILDPFLGSGTTLIAAEQLDRTCYGIEIEPRYVDVTVERWQNLTGGKAKRS